MGTLEITEREFEKYSDNTLYLYVLLTGGLLDINVMTRGAKCMLTRRDKPVTTNAGDTYSGITKGKTEWFETVFSETISQVFLQSQIFLPGMTVDVQSAPCSISRIKNLKTKRR